ncbi:phage tail protein [Massilia agilis]|uniref:Phage tail protein n=1 Tax=Massilia agilis TaxID=1811226 RepID=A0ABT2DBN5_9BURK|nr:phage tail protein [Massilia agilis]MCS0808687.1 phage tail protein [Massilia agilis]
MSLSLPNGTTYAVASAYAAAIAVSAASNATECVLTTATNTYAIGDFIEFTSGWDNANLRVFRVKAAAATSVTLEGFDTTSTTLFPAGAGIGSVRKISTWQNIPQVLSCDASGGDAQYTTVSPIASKVDVNLPNGFSAMSLALTIGDDPTLPHHAVLKAASIAQTLMAVKATLPNGGPLLANGYCSFNETPTMAKGQVMAVKASFALLNMPVRYAT